MDKICQGLATALEGCLEKMQQMQGLLQLSSDGDVQVTIDAAEAELATAAWDRGLEIRRVLVLSTIHITQYTLEHFNHWPHIGEHEFGVYFSVPVEEGHEELDLDCPLDLIGVLQFASQHHCDEVKFDRDGPKIEGLQTYEEEWR